MQETSKALTQPGKDEVRELSTSELEQVSGGFVEILAYAAGSSYAYYKWLKANHKLP